MKESHLYESEMTRLPTEPEGKIMIARATLREHATLIQGSHRRSWEIFAVQIDRQIDRVCLVDKCGVVIDRYISPPILSSDFFPFLCVSASANAGCCVRRSDIIYRQASTGSSVLLEKLQEMAEQKSNPVWQHFTEHCSTSPFFKYLFVI